MSPRWKVISLLGRKTTRLVLIHIVCPSQVSPSSYLCSMYLTLCEILF
jgi:hypothetical protein